MAKNEGAEPIYKIASYTVFPSGFDELVHPEKEQWTVTVADAGDGWAIRRGNMCLNYRNEWEYEPPRSVRDDAFLRRSRYNEHAALLRSKRVIDQLEFKGVTFAAFAAEVRVDLTRRALDELTARRERKAQRRDGEPGLSASPEELDGPVVEK